jgi:hypothetical protein
MCIQFFALYESNIFVIDLQKKKSSFKLIITRKMYQKCFRFQIATLPNAPKNFARVKDSKKLIFSCGLVKVSSFLIDEECVWNPDQVDVFCSDNKFLQTRSSLERQSRICPELSEVHVHCEVLN